MCVLERTSFPSRESEYNLNLTNGNRHVVYSANHGTRFCFPLWPLWQGFCSLQSFDQVLRVYKNGIIVRVIKKIGRPFSRNPICLIRTERRCIILQSLQRELTIWVDRNFRQLWPCLQHPAQWSLGCVWLPFIMFSTNRVTHASNVVLPSLLPCRRET